MAIPIFVLGKQRSGTTWLANQLCEHESIAGIQHDRHFGIHESSFFSTVLNRYGDLGVRQNYIELVEVMSASDYFRLAGSTREYLYSLWPTSYEGVFRSLMDRYAHRQKADFWIEKSPSHTPLVKRIADVYPDARFVGVIRDAPGVVASTTALTSHRYAEHSRPAAVRRLHIAGLVLTWSYYNRVLSSFSRGSDRVMIVEYDELIRDNVEVLTRICQFLGLPFQERMRQNRYHRDTSFQDEGTRRQTLSSEELRLIDFTRQACEVLPLTLLERCDRLMRSTGRRRTLPPWFFRLLRSGSFVGEDETEVA